MTFDAYQDKTNKTAVYPTCQVMMVRPGEEPASARYLYPALGLAGETGEVLEKLKKAVRDEGGLISDARKQDLKKELGDVLWYVAQICQTIGVSMDDCATGNLTKLADRKARGVLHGSGDNR